MKLNGIQDIPLPREQVWRELNNPETLRRCIPGCEQYRESGPGVYDAVVKSSIGPVTATFRGTSTVLEPRENEGLKLEGKGSGGAAGFGKVLADVRLEDSGSGTRLAYSAEAQVGGKLAQVGARLIQSVASRFVDDFFVRFKEVACAAQAADLANKSGRLPDVSPTDVRPVETAGEGSSSANDELGRPPTERNWWRRLWRRAFARPATGGTGHLSIVTNMLPPVRRLVTADNAAGRSFIQQDGRSPAERTVAERPGYRISNLWRTSQSEPVDTPDAICDHKGVAPPHRGTVLRIIDWPAEHPDPEVLRKQLDATFASMYPDAHREVKAGEHPGMHRTDTIDYAIVLAGEMVAILDEAETVMKVGDVLIQRGTNHAWANRSGQPARICFILIDAARTPG